MPHPTAPDPRFSATLVLEVPMRASLAMMMVGLLVACGSHEGDEPGECSDGADNDHDGYFDCNDLDCTFAPACDGEGGGTDTDTGTDTTGGGDPDPRLLELSSVDIAYTMAIDFELPVFGVEDCTMIYAGAGSARTAAAAEASTERVTFAGTWKKTGGTCPSELDELIWADADGQAFHTFRFSSGLATIEEWHAHERADAHSADDSSKPHWFMTEMGETYDHGSPAVTHLFEEKVGEIQATLKHSVTITFAK